MKKLIITLLFSVLFVSGCSIIKVSNDSVSDIFRTILYVDNNLSNTFMEGYKFYLPQGVKIVDKSDYNFKIKDNKAYYYLYIDTIAYHYKTKKDYNINDSHFYSQIIEHNGINGYVDIKEVNNKYFIVLMYNYAKIEAYIEKNDFNETFTNMCYILSTIKFNDEIINDKIGENSTIFQEEEFNIFDSKHENDNFLTYEKEYGTYKGNSNDFNDFDNDVLDDIETIE